jgi:hypothetical protein
VAITPAPLTSLLIIGQTLQLTATTRDATGATLTGRSVAWVTSAPAVLTVDATGRVSTVAAGTATVTATSEGKSTAVALTVEALRPNNCPPLREWLMQRSNACRTGYVAVTLDPAAFRTAWDTVLPPSGAADLNPVATSEGKVFVTQSAYATSAPRVAALDAATGALRWWRASLVPPAISAPAYANGRVYFTNVTPSGSGSFVESYDAATGQLMFRASPGAAYPLTTAPLALDGALYLVGDVRGAHRLAGTNAKQAWASPVATYPVNATPALSGNLLYVYDGDLQVLHAETGERVLTIPDPYPIPGQTSVMVVLGSGHRALAIVRDRLVAFDVAERRIRWEQPTGFLNFPAVRDGVVYAGRQTGIEARSESDGSLLWSWTGGRPTSMVVTDNLLIIGTPGATYAVDLVSHATVWRWDDGTANHQVALSAEQGMLYIVQSTGKLTAIAVR